MSVFNVVLIPAKTTENAQTGCVEWLGMKSRDGYGIAHRGGKLVKRHRLAYCAANGLDISDINGKVVRHKCDNRACINPDHLELGTQQDNTRDRVNRGRCARGSRDGNAKLNENKVAEIRAIYKPWDREVGAIPLAKRYNVSPSLIRQIGQNLIWRHVGELA